MCQKNKHGFTIIEIIITTLIIGTLTIVGVFSFAQIKAQLRDSQRSTNITIISAALEKYYDKNGSYPDCVDISKSATEVSKNTLTDIDINALKTPSAKSGDNSIRCTESSDDAFFYDSQGLQFAISYRKETNNNILTVSYSKHTTEGLPNTTVTATTFNSSQINLSWGAISGATSYNIDRSTNSDFTQNLFVTTQAGNTLSSTGLNSGIKYYYRIKGLSSTKTSGWSNTADATTTIVTPAAPTVIATTNGTMTNWDWNTPSCPAGTTARYQYRHTTDGGFDSGITAKDTNSVGFTTGVGSLTYTVSVQSQCYTSFTSSNWSSAGAANYYRPVYLVTLISGGNGTVSGGGTYADSSVQTITATPNTNYVFSSWTGSAGCSGTASHSITIDGVKNCTANFEIAPPTMPTVTASIVGTTATGTSSSVSCGLGTPEYQLRYHSTSVLADGTWSSWITWSSSVMTMNVGTLQGHKYTFQSQARCNYSSVYSGTAISTTANVIAPITDTPTVAPVWTGPLVVESDQWFYNTFSGSCPDGYELIGGYDTIVQKTEFPHHPWGYYDYWTNSSGTKTEPIQVRGYYQCQTAYAISAQSPLGIGDVTMNPHP